MCFCVLAAASILCLIPLRSDTLSAYCCFQEVNLQVLEICMVHILHLFFLPQSLSSLLGTSHLSVWCLYFLCHCFDSNITGKDTQLCRTLSVLRAGAAV